MSEETTYFIPVSDHPEDFFTTAEDILKGLRGVRGIHPRIMCWWDKEEGPPVLAVCLHTTDLAKPSVVFMPARRFGRSNYPLIFADLEYEYNTAIERGHQPVMIAQFLKLGRKTLRGYREWPAWRDHFRLLADME